MKLSSLAAGVALALLVVPVAQANLLSNGDFTAAPIIRGANLYRESYPTPHDTWYLKDVDNVFHDAANDWVENNNDSRQSGSLLQTITDDKASSGNLTLQVVYTNDEIVTGSANTQYLTLDVFGVDSGWGTPDYFSIGGYGTSNIPGNAVPLFNTILDLSTDHLTPTTYTSPAFGAAPGFDYLVVRVQQLGVGALAGTEEYVRVHELNLTPGPAPLALLAAGAIWIGRRRTR